VSLQGTITFLNSHCTFFIYHLTSSCPANLGLIPNAQ
jgi:hypothetical protein